MRVMECGGGYGARERGSAAWVAVGAEWGGWGRMEIGSRECGSRTSTWRLESSRCEVE
jgi:hypothetical protein